jgi:hypothetical protein
MGTYGQHDGVLTVGGDGNGTAGMGWGNNMQPAPNGRTTVLKDMALIPPWAENEAWDSGHGHAEKGLGHHIKHESDNDK